MLGKNGKVTTKENHTQIHSTGKQSVVEFLSEASLLDKNLQIIEI